MECDARVCSFNMDTGCVELLLRDGRKISIDCTGVEDALDVTMAQRAELDYLIYNDLLDMAVMGRAQLADPDFCNKCREGRVEEIDRCVGCNQGCLDGFADLNMPHITCLRNPAIGRETECAAAMQPTQSPKTILIAGGGIAGLEAARTLKLKGHNPILCEASDALGGQFVLAGKAPRKEEMEAAIQSMASQVQRMGVDVRLNTPVTPELIEEIKPAAVFNCIGATPLIPKIPGAEAIPSLEEGYPTLFSILHNSSFYNSFPERPLKGFLRGSLFFRKNDLHSSVECGWAPWGGRVRTKQKQGAPLNRTHPEKSTHDK